MGRQLVVVDMQALKEPLKQLAAAQGVTPSELVRGLVRGALEEGSRAGEGGNVPGWSPSLDGVGQSLQAVDGVEEKPKRQMSIRLTESELEGIKVFARVEGYTPNRWVASLIRAALSGTPQFSSRETTVVMHSNSNLLAIGRNLNQAVKRLHVAPNERESFRVERIDELSRDIKNHVRAVSALVTANIKRWRLEPK